MRPMPPARSRRPMETANFLKHGPARLIFSLQHRSCELAMIIFALLTDRFTRILLRAYFKVIALNEFFSLLLALLPVLQPLSGTVALLLA